MVTIYDPYTAIIELRDAIEAIQLELGVNPGGVYADTRVRLDILEARINNPLVPAPNVENPFFIGNDGVTISTGFGYPTEDRLDGSLYLRQDGYVNEGLYSHRNGAWHRIDTDPWTAAGDLFGVYNFQKVVGLQGRALSDVMPEDGYHLTWNNSSTVWEPQIGFYASNDLSGTKISQTVVGIQNKQIDSSTPADGDILTWNDINNHWQPQANAVIFDDIVARSNIKANRLIDPSVVDSVKLGIVNFGSLSEVNDSYSTISGGYDNSCNAPYSFVGGGAVNNIATVPTSEPGANNIVGGSQNTIESLGYANIIGGSQNYISDQYASTIVSGGLNLITGSNGVVNTIISGVSNSITDSISAIIATGAGNEIFAGSNYSSIINGNIHDIYGTDSVILSGYENSILNASQYGTILNGEFNIIDNSVHATVVSGNSNIVEVSNYGSILSGQNNYVLNGIHSSILNGDGNQVKNFYSAIINGSNNIINSPYSTILNGYNHNATVNSNHSIILNGDTNYIDSTYGMVGGNFNNISGTSDFSFVYGISNVLTNANYSNINGFSNVTNDSAYVNVFGQNNSISMNCQFIKVLGDSNFIDTNSKYINVFGIGNSVYTGSYVGDLLSSIFGNNNTSYGHANSIIGGNNYVSGNYSHSLGNYNNIGSLSSGVNYSLVHGSYGKSSYEGQYVQSTGALNTSPGSSQYSRLILDGDAAAGGAFTLSCVGNSLQFEDGKSYDITLRLLVVNTNGVPTCARYVYDILAHQESGSLVIDNFNTTMLHDNGTGWTVTIAAATNQLDITIDSVGVEDRRCMATIEWRELSRA